jgi:hypothetical protein
VSIEVINEGHRTGRKAHQCFDCYREIPKGEAHFFQTCKYDHVYTLRQHDDCRAASEFYREFHNLHWDFYDGIPPLADMISDGGEMELDHALLRGHFPHVVCRLELANQYADIRLQDRTNEVFYHAKRDPLICPGREAHEFTGWRDFEDGRGGEQVCTHCGVGAMEHTLALDI